MPSLTGRRRTNQERSPTAAVEKKIRNEKVPIWVTSSVRCKKILYEEGDGVVGNRIRCREIGIGHRIARQDDIKSANRQTSEDSKPTEGFSNPSPYMPVSSNERSFPAISDLSL